MNIIYGVSLDPAQLHDFSALAVVECCQGSGTTGRDNLYRLVSLKRKQRLPYPEIVTWAKKVFLNPKFQARAGVSAPRFVIDAGGVGRAVYDMAVAEGINPVAIQLTGGDLAGSYVDGTYHVSKSLLVGTFLMAWDSGRVQVPAKASFLPMLEAELKAFRGSMTAQGRAKFEAEQGEHDDLVMALAQCVWYFEKHNWQQSEWLPPTESPCSGTGYDGPFSVHDYF
jgi:hypothetical protein